MDHHLSNDGRGLSRPPIAPPPQSSAAAGAAVAQAVGGSGGGTAAASRSAVLDEAYEEYCRLQRAGEALDPDAFCARFPAVKSSLGQLLRAHRFLEENPHLLERTAPAAWPEPGQDFLGFTLLRELGRGAFARVFLAAEAALGGRLVALKVSGGGAAEAQTLGPLDHPNVVPVHSAREDPASGLTAVCMPYRGNATLCSVLDHAFAGPRPPTCARVILRAAEDAAAPDPGGVRQAPARVLLRGAYVDGVVHLAAQLADGLAFIHARGICHRDLKPSNVLLSPDGRPMLLDFNLCAGPLAAGRLGGTLPYMAPEQLRALAAGPGQDLDARSDIYSLGVILYELLTGQHPAGPLPLKLEQAELRRHLLERQQAGPRPLRQANPDVDQRLARLVERCLAWGPQDRPASAAALAADLRSCLSPLGRARRWVGRHRRAVLAAALAGLLVLLTGAYLWSLRDPYAVRRLNRGLDDYRQGEYARAVECFTDALQADPRLARALFARGRAYQRLGAADKGNFGLALGDFQRADELTPSGKIKACLGYCSNRLELPRDAKFYYEEATAAGFANAAVFNNLGCTYLELGDLRLARENLDRALALDPTLQAAFHNRALAYLQQALRRRAALGPPQQVGGGAGKGARRKDDDREAAAQELSRLLEKGFVDVRQAMERGPVTAKLCYDATRLCVLAAEFGGPAPPAPDYVTLALDYAERAVRHGHNPQGLAADPLLKGLKQQRRFQDLTRLPPPAGTPQQPSRLIDPLRGLPD
jgi:tetratricopeptide (TPR) repeat protein